MNMAEIVDEVSFMLGIPANDNIEGQQIEKAVIIAFNELKRYMKTPVDITVPYSPRIDLVALGIHTVNVLYVQAAKPRIGLSLGTIESGNIFQLAANVNAYGAIGQSSALNIDPIVAELATAQVRNTLATDFQWKFDIDNQVIYCAHRDPKPTHVTIRYVPDYQDVSEIKSPTWINYLIRLSEAYMKKSLGRTRSKYRVEGSNVTLDGEELLQEANAELDKIREELEGKRRRLVVLN